MHRTTFVLIGLLVLVVACAEQTANGGDDVSTDPGPVDVSADADSGADVDGSPSPSMATMTALVDPTIGTGGRGWWAGNAFVGATMPFGLVQVAPDTTHSTRGFAPWDHCDGYHGEDDTILAFSHNHLHGTGIPDLGAVGFMPMAGAMDEAMIGSHSTRFDRDSEQARLGHYAVELDSGVRVELAATSHTAYHRYESVDGAELGQITLLVDLSHTISPGLITDGGVSYDEATRRFVAWAHNRGEFARVSGGFPIFHVGELRQEPSEWGVWEDGAMVDGSTAEGNAAGLWFTFERSDADAVELQVGMSYTDADHAEANLDAQLRAWDFDAAVQSAYDTWEEALSVMEIEGGAPEDRTIMATSLYHNLLMPTELSDLDGTYVGIDGEVRQADHRYFTNFSLWDTYRTTHPLLMLLYPDAQAEMLLTLERMGAEGGYLPRWPLGPVYTNIMIGTPADIVIAESWLKGYRDFDLDAVYPIMRSTALEPAPDGHPFSGRVGVESYVDLGYVAVDEAGQSVARTQEFAIADFALANLAAATGRADDAAMFREMSLSYRNVFDPDQGYFVARNSDGMFEELRNPRDSSTVGAAYTEGNALQYLWLVPHEPYDLMTLLGGAEPMADRLSELFEGRVNEAPFLPNEDSPDLDWITSPPQFYWHGNEPDIHAAYLFVQAGRPDLTQRWVRWIQDELYTAERNGIPGNDDAGTLAGWYVFSSLGFYPIAGSDLYVIGTPRFPEVTLRLWNGSTLSVEALGVSDTAMYVQSVTLNGEAIDVPWLRHGDLAQGGTLRFEMGEEPSGWGVIGPDVAIPTRVE